MFHALLLMAVSVIPSLGTSLSTRTNAQAPSGPPERTHCRGWTGAAALPKSSSGCTTRAAGPEASPSASQRVRADTDTATGCAACVAQTQDTSSFCHAGLPPSPVLPHSGLSPHVLCVVWQLIRYCFDEGDVAQLFVHPQSHTIGRIKCKTTSFRSPV